MLVYCKDYLGYSNVGNKPVYGRGYNRGRFGPTEISYGDYLKNFESLIKVPYTKVYLEQKYKKEFPQIEFCTWHELKNCKLEDIIEVAKALEIDWKNRRSLSLTDIEGLAQAVCRKLSE